MASLAIVGATGAVGEEAMAILNESPIDYSNLKLLASASSAGKRYTVREEVYAVEELNVKESFKDVDYAILAVDSALSEKIFRENPNKDCVFIDNSSAFRMSPLAPLVIPEINIDKVREHDRMVCNPNCSTIIMLMSLYPIHKRYGISSITVDTYQAASGAGKQAMKELESQATSFSKGEAMDTTIFGRQYLFNAFSHNSDIDPKTGFNGEEIKMIEETHKILEDKRIDINPTCIRIPTLRSHLESITVELKTDGDVDTIRNLLEKAPGVVVQDNIKENKFPEPLDTSGTDNVSVGRIRRSFHKNPRIFQLIVSGDQIRKGAALNALQIYDHLKSKFFKHK